MTRTLIASLFLLSLGACGGSDTAGKSTTKLDAVEVQPGSVSDSMIILDSVPDDGTKKDAAKTDEADAADDAAPESEADDNPEAVDMPVARKALTGDAATKKAE